MAGKTRKALEGVLKRLDFLLAVGPGGGVNEDGESEDSLSSVVDEDGESDDLSSSTDDQDENTRSSLYRILEADYELDLFADGQIIASVCQLLFRNHPDAYEYDPDSGCVMITFPMKGKYAGSDRCLIEAPNGHNRESLHSIKIYDSNGICTAKPHVYGLFEMIIFLYQFYDLS